MATATLEFEKPIFELEKQHDAKGYAGFGDIG